MSRYFVYQSDIEPVRLRLLGGHSRLASPPFHLALPNGRFSPSRQDLRFAPAGMFALSLLLCPLLTSMYARAGQFRKHCRLWRFIDRAHLLSFAPNMVPHISIEALCLRLRQCPAIT
jgi:hypothetical protein